MGLLIEHSVEYAQILVYTQNIYENYEKLNYFMLKIRCCRVCVSDIFARIWVLNYLRLKF